MSNMDYDVNQPKHAPIILSIIVTIAIILIMTFALLIYFQGSLKAQENKNEQVKSNSFDLTQLKKWEQNFLESKHDDKISIDDAIYITITRYNK